MQERDEIVQELKHLVKYYHQAAREFFDDASTELDERLNAFSGCLEANKNSLDEYRKMIELLVAMQTSLSKRIQDLNYLTDRMSELFKSP